MQGRAPNACALAGRFADRGGGCVGWINRSGRGCVVKKWQQFGENWANEHMRETIPKGAPTQRRQEMISFLLRYNGGGQRGRPGENSSPVKLKQQYQVVMMPWPGAFCGRGCAARGGYFRPAEEKRNAPTELARCVIAWNRIKWPD